MKKKIYIGLAVVLVAIIGFWLYGALVLSKRSPEKTTEFSALDTNFKVVYCQPSKRERLIFGEESAGALQPYGKYWRLGANAATEITFTKNINFAGKPVNAGTYRMYAVPGPSSFQVSLNSELGVTLSAANEPDYTKDVIKVDVPTESIPEVEQFIINFSSDSNTINMDFMWDRVKVRVPITIQ